MGRRPYSESEGTKLVREYLKKYTDIKKLTLAKKIYKEHPHLYKNADTVRGIIRKIKGASGARSLKEMADKSMVEPINHDSTPPKITVKSRAEKLKVFKLPKSIKSVLFLSDIHLPYQDDIALNTAIKYGIDNKVDCIWLNGDTLDMYGASDHEKLPGHALLNEEFDMAREFLSNLRSIFPNAQIYFKCGNHEQRWIRLLMRKAPEIVGCEEFELKVLLKFAEYKVHWIENETLVKFGKLNVLHGNEFKGGGGVNPARALYMRAKANAIAGDKHKTGENTDGSLDGKIITTWSVGCLCDLNPKYMPFAHTSWNNGFAHITMNGENFHVKNFRIYNGKIL